MSSPSVQQQQSSSTTLTTSTTLITASFPFMYGSAASYIVDSNDAQQEGATHKWTFYVRGLNGQDLSPVISKVVFMLHPTCSIPIVECTKYPFETTQTGWGEFNAGIKIYFHGIVNHSGFVTVHHLLRFTPDGSIMPLYDGTPVVKEMYDEVIFKDPSPDLLQRLKLVSEAQPIPHPLSMYWPKTLPIEENLKTIIKADTWVKKEIARLVSELGKVDAEIDRHKKVRLAATTTSNTNKTTTTTTTTSSDHSTTITL
jgi:YEATS domain-containing protein 4